MYKNKDNRNYMALEMIKRYITSIIYSVILLGLLGVPLSVAAQQELTREERIKILEALKAEDEKTNISTVGLITSSMPTEIDKLELPPLSVFLDAVIENATVKRAQSQVEQVRNQYRLQKRNWWNYFRFNGNYSYGRYNVIGNASDEFTPMYQTTMSSAQHNFNVGASVGISLGELFNRPLKLKDYRYQIEQLQYSQEEVMEQRKLRVLEAYNAVTEQLATIKAKAESAALYNAQMKISENNFIQGTIDIISLSLERARRSGAVVSYEQARVALHNSIILLEMLTNVKVIKDK
jgi:outer membrane protein TolC